MSRATFLLDGNTLHFRSGAESPSQSRPLVEQDQAGFSNWAATYHDIVADQSKADPSPRLRVLGKEIATWLTGPRHWLKSLLDSAPVAPLIIEFEAHPGSANALSPQQIAFLSVPWELLADPTSGIFWAERSDLQYSPVRRIGLAAEPEQPSQQRLQMIFMAAAPLGQTALRFEDEEAAIQRATGGIGLDLIVEESGVLERLGELLRTESQGGRVDVLHISCHGTRAATEPFAEPAPALALEDDPGFEKLARAHDLAGALGDCWPRLVMLSACESDAAAGSTGEQLQSFTLRLALRGAPAVLGWNGKVLDADATRFAAAMYGELAKFAALEVAVARARHALLRPADPQTPPARDWHRARLTLRASGGGVFTKGTVARHRADARKIFLDARGNAIPVAGPDEFVGRRKELKQILRQFLPALADQRDKCGAFLHGQGRQGKSSLAARVAQRLPHHEVIVHFQKFTARDVLDKFRPALTPVAWDNYVEPHLVQVDHNPDKLEGVLRELLNGPLAQHVAGDPLAGRPERKPVLLVLDDFEATLEHDCRTLQYDMQRVVVALVRAFATANTKSRLLITCRYMCEIPDEHGADQFPKFEAIHLVGMETFERQKLLANRLREKAYLTPTAEERVRWERLAHPALGNPGLQDRLIKLAQADPAECDRALDAMQQYLDGGQAPQQQDLADFLNNLVLDQLLGQLNEGQWELLRASTLFEVPLPLSVLADLASTLASGPEACARLLSLTLWDQFADLVHRDQPAALINPLVRPKVTASTSTPYFAAGLARRALTDNEPAAVASAVITPLFTAWGGPTGSQRRPYTADIALCELALRARDADILVAVATDAVAGCEQMFQYRAAARLGKDALQVLRARGIEPSLMLLKRTGEMSARVGDVVTARDSYACALQTVQQRPPASLDEAEDFASILIAHARQLDQDGQPDAALEVLEQASQYLAAPQFARERAIVSGDIARIYVDKGRVDEALKLHQERLQVFQELGDARSRAVTLGDIARIYVNKGRVDEALKLHQEMLHIFQELGDARSRAVTLGDIARIYVNKGRVDEALKLHQEMLHIFQELGDARSRAVTLGDIAGIYVNKGRVDEALKLHQEMLLIFQELGDARSSAVTLGDIARIYVNKGRVDEALKLHQDEIKIYEELGDARSRAVTLGDIARIYVNKGRVDEALKLHQERLVVFRDLEDISEVAQTLWSMAKIELQREEIQPAFEHLAEAYQINNELGRLDGICMVGLDLGQLLCANGQQDQGLPILRRSLAGFQQLGYPGYPEHAAQILARWEQPDQ